MIREMKLESLCTKIVDCEHKTSPQDLTGTFFAVGTPAMKENRIDYGQARRISGATFGAWTRRLRPRFGDLLLAREAPVGPVVRIPQTENVASGQRTVLLRPNPTLADSNFLFYLLTSPRQQGLLQVKAAGSTVSHLNVADVRAFPVSIPELRVQRAIAEVLGALDDKIAANTMAAATADQIAVLQFKSMLADAAITGAASVFSVDQLVGSGDLVISDGYRTRRSELSRSGYRIIRVADIRAGEIALDSDDFVSEEYVQSIGVKAGQEGDVLLTTKGTVGRVAVVPRLKERVVYSPQLCFFRVQEVSSLDRWFLKRWLGSAEFLKQASYRMNNSDMAPYISLADIRSLRMTLPSVARQRELSEILGPLEEVIAASFEENQALAVMRDTLLPLLMSGKLRVGDAEKQVEAVV